MNIEEIETRIAALRKERGIKQEELANCIGVTAQAVSKWENGGAPDTELLPAIADFFEVSLDFLFGRSEVAHGDLRTALSQKIADSPVEERFKVVFNLCWDIERSLFGNAVNGFGDPDKWDTIEDNEKELGAQDQVYSSILSDYGFTRMGVANRLQYFLLVPEVRDTQAAFFDGIDYPSFFADFSDKDVFDACVMLCRRENGASFTPNLLVKRLGIAPDRAQAVIEVLKKYQLLGSSQIEMDDEIQTVYCINSGISSFVALLIFARELIDPPHSFYYHSSGRSKPYL